VRREDHLPRLRVGKVQLLRLADDVALVEALLVVKLLVRGVVEEG
jgi:hypothetical protein